MASATGIEIGPDSFLFADVRPVRADDAEVLSARRFAAPEWPADRDLFVDALRSIRREHRFPRRAAVVIWNTTDAIDGAAQHDPLASLTAAGFEIVSVMTPPQALTQVATTVRGGDPSDAIAWLALNTRGASIAIVRDRLLLFARTFPWTYRDDLQTSKAQLLQRYLLISQLAPELAHGFKTVREADGATVSLIVTCGNLPELRSLTLPLIEELDIEVETLDSTAGLLAGRNLRAGEFTDLAPAVRLATAAALTAGALPRRDSMLIQGSRFAAATAVIAALAWTGYSFWHSSQPSPARQSSAPQPTSPAASADIPRSTPSQPATNPTQTSGNPTPLPVATRGSDEPNRAMSPAQDTLRRVPREQSRKVPSDTKTAAPPQASSPAASLNEPLPRIDSVLIDQDRRLAILDGAVVGVGDPVGSRVVVAIAREAILLREPSGRIVRVRPRVGM
jgi:hypothetical protein